MVGPGELAVSPRHVLLGSSPGSFLQATVLGSPGGGAGGGPAWGDEVTADDVARLSLLKLALLHPDAIQSANPEHPGRTATVRAEIDKIWATGKTGPGAIAEYIGRLLPDMVAQIQDYIGAFGLRLADLNVRFVFGIPAVWGNDAIARLRDAVEDSGILRLLDGRPAPMDFITEPEAAAMALVPGIARSHALQVRCPPIMSMSPMPARADRTSCRLLGNYSRPL